MTSQSSRKVEHGSHEIHEDPSSRNEPTTRAIIKSFEAKGLPLTFGHVELVLVGGAEPARDRDPRLVYLASLTTPKSRRAMASALERIAVVLGTHAARIPWHSLRYQHTAAIRARLVEAFAPATVNQALAALRGVLREAARLELMSADEAVRACDLRPARSTRLPRGRALAAAEVRAIFAASDSKTRAGARDRALVAILYGCGLRRAELVELELADYDAGAGTLRIRGKGNKERGGHVASAARALQAWLDVRGDAPGPIFVPVDRFDRVTPRRMTDQAVREILRRLARRAGVADFSPHDLRRTFISDLLDAGADISTVQQMAGHAQVTTTARYDRRGEDAKRRAAGLLRIEGATT